MTVIFSSGMETESFRQLFDHHIGFVSPSLEAEPFATSFQYNYVYLTDNDYQYHLQCNYNGVS